MTYILDRLDVIEKVVPLLASRIDHNKVVVAGHSLGGFTASQLLGARITDPGTGQEANLIEPCIKAGMLLAAPGRDGKVLTGFMAAKTPFFRTTDFSAMTTPALVIAGDKDDSRHFTDMGPAWHTDPCALAPGSKALLAPVRRGTRTRWSRWIRRRRDHRREPWPGRGARAAHCGLPPEPAPPRRHRVADGVRGVGNRTRTGRMRRNQVVRPSPD